jgi:RHS repeat-associated protein
MTFWAYGAKWNGWWVYGHGTVTANGKSVVPGKGTYLTSFDGAMFNSGPAPPAAGPACSCEVSDPADLSSGLFALNRTDLTEPDTLPLTLTRNYRPGDPSVYRFGLGTNDLYGINLWSASLASSEAFTDVSLVLPDGRQIPYTRTTPGSGFADAEFAVAPAGDLGAFAGSIMDWDGEGWNLALRNGLTYTFGEIAPLQSITDRYGDAIEVIHTDGDPFGDITDVTSPNGRWIAYGYHSLNCSVCVSGATDNSGRTTSYAYDSSERLISATDVRGHTESYSYDTSNNLTTVTDRLGHTVLTNAYSPDGTLATQTRPGGGTEKFSYTRNTKGRITSAQYTDPRGATETMTFNSLQEPLTVTLADGTALQRTTTYTYAPSGLETSMTDPLARKTTYQYDSLGNPTAVTQLAGTSEARTTTIAYDPLFSRITALTDPLGNTTTWHYTDTLGTTKVTATDPTGRTATMVIDNGNPVSVTDGTGATATLNYDGGDLASVTNPDHQTTSQFTDTAGLATQVTTPLGDTRSYSYDPAGDLTGETDPLGNTTAAAYDPAGDLTSFTDAGHHTTTYTYDDLYRLTSQTDPLGATQHYGYDAAGDLTTYTDRDGTADTATYDLLGELTAASWGVTGTSAQDTATLTYDSAGRLLSDHDATSGTITNTYDAFDDLTSQAQPHGTVTYTYDADNRPTSMTPGNGPAVTYTYDKAGRTAAVTVSSKTSALSYDAAGRLAKVTDPGGVTESFTYDPAGSPTKITATGTPHVTTTYGYDADGLQADASASTAQFLDPSSSSAAFNADNELTSLNGTQLSYDANGALVKDGASAFTWNAKQQLTGVTSASASAKITDDPFGRVSAVKSAGKTSTYLYDRTSPVLTTGPTGSTSYADDPSTRDTLLETSPKGIVSLIANSLGSITGVYSSSGSLLTSYAYDPFGQSSATNPAASTNDIGYAGYQQNVPGLGTTTARYYDSALGRFISQDPIGLAGGQNAYAYASNDPLDFTDPTGLGAESVAGWLSAINAAAQLGASAKQLNQPNTTDFTTLQSAVGIGSNGAFFVSSGASLLGETALADGINLFAGATLGPADTILGVVATAQAVQAYNQNPTLANEIAVAVNALNTLGSAAAWVGTLTLTTAPALAIGLALVGLLAFYLNIGFCSG